MPYAYSRPIAVIVVQLTTPKSWRDTLYTPLVGRPKPVAAQGRIHMITEIVTFTLPEGMTREDVLAAFEKTAPTWRANPDLVRKNYLIDVRNRIAGGVYLWKD